MKLNRTGSRWDRFQRININDNWDEIERKYRPLLNLGKEAESTLKKALEVNAEAQKTNNMNENVQQQIDTLIAESGTSDSEVLQARIDGDGNEYAVLKDRLDAKEGSFSTELSEKSTKSELYSDLPTPKSMSLSANGNNRVPFISFVDDDGFLQYYNVMAPMLEERGFTGTAAIITSTTGTSGRMTVDHLRDLQERGFELASHTHDHLGFQSDGLTPDEIEYQCRHSKELLVSWGLQVNNLVYRGGQSGGDVAIERVKKYYRSGIVTNTAANNDQHRELKDEYRILRVNAQGNTLQSLKDNVDYCLANNTWLIFMTHAHGHTEAENVIIGQLLDYIKLKNVAVGTLNEGLDLFGNTFSVGSKEYIKVLAGGEIYSNAIGTVFKNPHEGYNINLDTPLSFFEPEKVTFSRFSTSDNVQFPELIYGTLETFCSKLSPRNSYQIWRPFGSPNEYRRIWDGTIVTGSWTDWETRGLVFNNDIKEDSAPSEIPNDIVLSSVNSLAGFPEPGTLLTLNKGANSEAKQMLFPATSNELYYRGYNLDGTGKEFMRVPKIRTMSFSTPDLTIPIGENHVIIQYDLSSFIGDSINTRSTPYSLTTITSSMDNVVFSSRIALGVIYISIVHPNKDSSVKLYSPSFEFTVFE